MVVSLPSSQSFIYWCSYYTKSLFLVAWSPFLFCLTPGWRKKCCDGMLPLKYFMRKCHLHPQPLLPPPLLLPSITRKNSIWGEDEERERIEDFKKFKLALNPKNYNKVHTPSKGFSICLDLTRQLTTSMSQGTRGGIKVSQTSMKERKGSSIKVLQKCALIVLKQKKQNKDKKTTTYTTKQEVNTVTLSHEWL